MAVLAGIANFGALEDGDTTLAAWLFSAVAALDVIVALALYAFFSPAHRRLALAVSLCRAAYAAAFAVAIGLLFAGGTAAFHTVWQAALLVFGAHLALLALLIRRTGGAPAWLAVLVAVAALGYLVDSTVHLLAGGAAFELSTVTFIGEVALLGWLLIRGGRGAAAVA